MQKICAQCTNQFEVTDEDLQFYDKISPVFADKKYPIPPPTLCPSCRMQKRMTFRNERNLYKRKCDFSGKEIISIYSPASPYTIYDQKMWWSDVWDTFKYGKPYDFNRTFFEQFQELLIKVPRINLENRENENSDYGNDNDHLRNCYLCFNGSQAEDSYYCNTFGFGVKDSVDLFWCFSCELCYECTKVHESYHSFWCFNGKNLSDCFFCIDSQSCKNCFGCVGLRQKEYCVYNEQLTKEEYQKFMENFKFTHTEIELAKEKVKALSLKTPHKNVQIQESENCVGDYISNSKNCTQCFDVIQSENSKYTWDGMVNNCYDCFNTGFNTNFVYECLGTYECTNVNFANKCHMSSDLLYSDYCFQSEKLFGCVGLKHKKYCILNKQYSKEEYEELVPKIIEQMKKDGQWGEFFPASFSPFGYNDSMAADYFPLTKEEALEKGFHWNDYINPKPIGMKTIVAKDLPESIQEVGDEILEWVIECEKDQKIFKIIAQELKFYRRHNLPLPRLCPDCRHYERKALINPRKLYVRECAKCDMPIQTSYSPDRPEIVYCEQCYLKEVY